jgi:hypothetical protein
MRSAASNSGSGRRRGIVHAEAGAGLPEPASVSLVLTAPTPAAFDLATACLLTPAAVTGARATWST